MSYALARGMLAAGLAVTASMTLGMIATIGGIALAAALRVTASWDFSHEPRAGGTMRDWRWKWGAQCW